MDSGAWWGLLDAYTVTEWKPTEAKPKIKWEKLKGKDYTNYDRPHDVPMTTGIKAGKITSNGYEAVTFLKDLLDGKEEKIFIHNYGDFTQSVLVNAEALGRHMDKEGFLRTKYYPFLIETIKDPYEIWASFEKSSVDGSVVLREYLIKGFELENDKKRGCFVVLQSINGKLETWTFVYTSQLDALNKRRVGILLYGK
ncbi:MAG: PBECR2 nuclease fold domain-containing protein [Nitrospirae bacterium YQR-1]